MRATFVHNIFDPLESREIREFPDGLSIGEILDRFGTRPGCEVQVSIDGRKVPEEGRAEYVPGPGSSVVICAIPGGGGGKNPLAIVAMLAVMVAAPYTAGAVLGAASYAMGGAGLILPMGTMAVLNAAGFVAGGLLVSSIFSPGASDAGPAAFSNSPTYSWEPGSNATAEGAVLPELYGTHRITPPIIGHYIETTGDKQYLNLLFAVAGHPVDSISGIRINETDIANFTGVTTAVRLGAVNQSVIPYFADTRSDTAVGVKAGSGDWILRTTSGNAVQGLGVTIAFPKGLFHVMNDGGIETHSVQVYVEYSVHDADTWTRLQGYNTTPQAITTGRWSGGYWAPVAESDTGWFEVVVGTDVPTDHVEGEPATFDVWVDAGDVAGYERKEGQWRWVENTTVYSIGDVLNDYVEVAGASTAPVHRSYYIDNLTPGRYDVRVMRVGEEQQDPRWGDEAYFESFQEIIYDDFQYPGVAPLAVRALATDQLSGSIPKIDCLATRATVPVWTGAKYEQKSASNPAWACYNVLHQARYKGTGATSLAASYDVLGEPVSRIAYREFLSWAGWCDNPAGDGSLAPHTVNIYLDSAFSIRKTLDMIGACGRGSVVQIGSRFTPIVDRPEIIPVQRFLFTPGNVEADSFSEEWLSTNDRANVVEVTYYDAEQDYTRQTVEVYSTDFDTTDRQVNRSQVTPYGITSRQKAIDLARFLLNSNRYMTLTTSHGADVDSIACLPGDVIEIAHDVPQWGYGGRVVSATTNTITLDRSVTLAEGTSYAVTVKHQDDDSREEKAITSAAGTYTTLSIASETWGKIPAKHAVYSVGEVGRVVKAMRVQRIETMSDMRRRLRCLEYVQEVFEDGATIPEPELVSDLPWIRNLKAVEVYRGGQETRVYLTWAGYAILANVFIRKAGGAWVLHGQAYKPSYELAGLDYGVLYEFAVSGTDDPAGGETASLTLVGKTTPPATVATITADQREYSILVEWSEVGDFDLAGYELRVESIGEPYPYPNLSPNWTGAEMLFRGMARSHVWTYKSTGAYLLHVRAFDAFGLYSASSATVIVEAGYPAAPDGSYAFSGPNAVLSWTIPDSAFAIDRYLVAYGEDYGTAVDIGTAKSTTFSVNVTWGGIRRFWITAVDVAGNLGTPEIIDVNVASPGAVTGLSPRVIDNNVLLQWTPAVAGSLPIAYYNVSRGDVYEASDSVGSVQGTFTAVIEQSAGSYTYWVVGVDSAGNLGAPVGIPATVNQPPDYIILQSWEDDFSGDKTSALVVDGKLYAPINITETIQEHFDDNSFASPQEQVSAEYPLWIQPMPDTATYQEVWDYGSLVTGLTKINLNVTSTPEYGGPTIAPSIEVSADGSSWGTAVEDYSALESGFRYIRITLTITGGGASNFLRVDSIRLKLDLKQKSDTGIVEVTTNGVQVDFNETFLDVSSITLTPQGTTALIPVYDFDDVPNPTHFHVYLFDASGNDASGAGKYVSWQVRGV